MSFTAEAFAFEKTQHFEQVTGLVRHDITFPRQRVAVFVDGCFWHLCPQHGNLPEANSLYWEPKLRRNVARDKVVSDALCADSGVRHPVWEHESVREAAMRVESVVAARRAQSEQKRLAKTPRL